MELEMNKSMVVVVPVGSHDPTPVLTQGMDSIKTSVDDAKEMILSCIGQENLGAFTVLGPSLNNVIQSLSLEDLIWGADIASDMQEPSTDPSFASMVNAWRKATLITFSLAANLEMSVFDFGPGSHNKLVQSSDLVLRIEMFGQGSDRNIYLTEDPRFADVPVFSPVILPDNEYGIVVPVEGNRVAIAPVGIRCSTFHQFAGRA